MSLRGRGRWGHRGCSCGRWRWAREGIADLGLVRRALCAAMRRLRHDHVAPALRAGAAADAARRPRQRAVNAVDGASEDITVTCLSKRVALGAAKLQLRDDRACALLHTAAAIAGALGPACPRRGDAVDRHGRGRCRWRGRWVRRRRRRRQRRRVRRWWRRRNFVVRELMRFAEGDADDVLRHVNFAVHHLAIVPTPEKKTPENQLHKSVTSSAKMLMESETSPNR